MLVFEISENFLKDKSAEKKYQNQFSIRENKFSFRINQTFDWGGVLV